MKIAQFFAIAILLLAQSECLTKADEKSISGETEKSNSDYGPNASLTERDGAPALIVRLALPGLWGDFSLSGKRVKVEASEVEEDICLESFPVSIAA